MRMRLNVTCVLQNERFGHRHADRKGSMWTWRQRLGVMFSRTKELQQTSRSYKRGLEYILPQSFQEEPTLPAPSSQTCSLQNREIIISVVQATQLMVLPYSSPRKWKHVNRKSTIHCSVALSKLSITPLNGETEETTGTEWELFYKMYMWDSINPFNSCKDKGKISWKTAY